MNQLLRKYRSALAYLSLVVISLAALLSATNIVRGFTHPTEQPPSGQPGPLAVSIGGTSATTTAQARINLGAAAAGANTDIVSLSPIGNLVFSPSGYVGIKNPSPAYNLDVGSGGAYTARIGSASSDTLVVGGGAGKLTVGTLDPVFNISGTQFATYAPGMIGVKEELSGVANLSCRNSQCSYAVDFSSATYGSREWLFRKITDFGAEWNGLIVSLTPGFQGQVWYKKDYASGRLFIFGSQGGEVSYRLLAPRFDWQSWSDEPSGLQPNEGLRVIE